MVQIGDIVRMPNGVLGIVTHSHRLMAEPDCDYFVHVYPFTSYFKKVFLFLLGRLSFEDSRIDTLEILHQTRIS